MFVFVFTGTQMLSADSPLTILIRRVVEPMGYELAGAEFMRRGADYSTLRVYIDRDAGITLDDCAAVSHQLSGVLDVEDPIPGHYDLEISSPGLDRLILYPEHFSRFAGKRIRVRLAGRLEGRRKLEGVLLGLTNGQVRLVAEDREWEIPLDSLESARLIPEW